MEFKRVDLTSIQMMNPFYGMDSVERAHQEMGKLQAQADRDLFFEGTYFFDRTDDDPKRVRFFGGRTYEIEFNENVYYTKRDGIITDAQLHETLPQRLNQ